MFSSPVTGGAIILKQRMTPCVPHPATSCAAVPNYFWLCSTNQWTNYDTAVDVAIRDAGYKPNPDAKSFWPSDKQGYELISHADTAENYAKHKKQWVKHETTFTAPSDTVSGRMLLHACSLYCSNPIGAVQGRVQ